MNHNKGKPYPLFSKYQNSLISYRYIPMAEKDNDSTTIFFSAFDKNTQRKVLIKKFNKELDKYHEFDVESYALENLDQDNIIKPIGIFEDDEYNYIVLPYADGGDLFDFISSKKISFNSHQLIHVAFSILSALEKIHSKGFIYRDIKLENIVILKKYEELPDHFNNNDFLLIDFGSCYIESKSKSIDDFRGTIYYKAPEYIYHQRVTEKYDIFSLGILLYYLAVSCLPIDPDIEYDEFEMKYLLDEKNIDRLFDGYKWKNISKEVKQLIKSMLLFDENIRPSSKELLKSEVFYDLLKPYEFDYQY